MSVTPEMERVKKNQENISSASGFIHFGLSQRMFPLLFTCSPVLNKIYFQEAFVIYVVNTHVISDNVQKLPLDLRYPVILH